MTDEEIIKGCIANDMNAQKHLYERFARKMMGICLRYAENTEEAQDLVQDGFIKVFQKINSFKGDGSLEGWTRKVMVNTALDSLRKKKKEKQRIEIDNEDDSWTGIEDGIIDAISAKDLLKIIQNLPRGYRTVFNLFAIEGYSHKEIGEMLHITESTSKSQYSRAKVQLQKMLLPEKVL